MDREEGEHQYTQEVIKNRRKGTSHQKMVRNLQGESPKGSNKKNLYQEQRLLPSKPKKSNRERRLARVKMTIKTLPNI